MSAKRSSPSGLKSITGATLLVLGFLILFANLDAVTGQITSSAGTAGAQTTGMLPALILAAIHAFQAYVFDHSGFFSGLLQLLVSFWPVILIIIGAVLLRDAFWGKLGAYQCGSGSPAMGDQ
jgi:hypothetical protein